MKQLANDISYVSSILKTVERIDIFKCLYVLQNSSFEIFGLLRSTA
jgi:hypothetical protein